jgi:hypothetical protein
MRRAILTAALLLLAGALVANPQTMNTFCSSTQGCTVTALWNFTGGLQNNGSAVPTLPINLASQVTGTLPGTNYAPVNLAGGNTNGGVTGTLPGPSVGVFVASGASHAVGAVPDPGSTAGTTRFLREDSTWVAPAGGSGFKFEGSNITPVTVGNTTALSPLQGVTIAASDIGSGQTFYIDAVGIIGDTAAAGITLGVYLDGVAIATFSPGLATANTQPWGLRGWFTCTATGSSGTVTGAIVLWQSSPSGGGVFTNTTGVASPAQSVTVNTTTSHTLQMQVQWVTANTSNTITSNVLTVHRIG